MRYGKEHYLTAKTTMKTTEPESERTVNSGFPILIIIITEKVHYGVKSGLVDDFCILHEHFCKPVTLLFWLTVETDVQHVHSFKCSGLVS